MKKIADEIIKGIRPKENLPAFAGRMMSLYSDYSLVRLAMNYFTYYEMLSEGSIEDLGLKELNNSLNDIIYKGIIKNGAGCNSEELLLSLMDIRQKVINTMKGLTSYVDIFNIYEYCLNRVEYRFKEAKGLSEISNEEALGIALKYILSDSDNAAVNSRILEVLRQLPLRMAKSKFFELIRNGLSVYKGSEISGFEDFLYMLETTSMLSISPHTELLGEELKKIHGELLRADFASMDEADYMALSAKMNFAVSYITENIDIYMTLGEIINDMYVILLSAPYAPSDTRDALICRSVAEKIYRLFEDGQSEEADIIEAFVNLEGRQEILNGRFLPYEYVTEHVFKEQKALLEELGLIPLYSALEKISILEAGSIFVEFTPKNTDKVDEEYIEAATGRLIAAMKGFFESHERLVNRAVMAHVLSGLPVFFNNIDELKEYIYSSLSQCRDEAERAAVIEILQSFEGSKSEA